jgi:hypothetical protein
MFTLDELSKSLRITLLHPSTKQATNHHPLSLSHVHAAITHQEPAKTAENGNTSKIVNFL